MEELLKELMDRGFLIYRYETDPPLSSAMPRPKFVLKKIRTPADDRPFDLGDGDDVLVEYFASFEEALEKAKKMIDWEEIEVKKAVMKNSWVMQLMFRHTGLGPQFADLGEVEGISFDEAVAEARKLAETHINKSLDEDKIDGWDVRVRPYHKNV